MLLKIWWRNFIFLCVREIFNFFFCGTPKFFLQQSYKKKIWHQILFQSSTHRDFIYFAYLLLLPFTVETFTEPTLEYFFEKLTFYYCWHKENTSLFFNITSPQQYQAPPINKINHNHVVNYLLLVCNSDGVTKCRISGGGFVVSHSLAGRDETKICGRR